jgi:hypothetical protein
MRTVCAALRVTIGGMFQSVRARRADGFQLGDMHTIQNICMQYVQNREAQAMRLRHGFPPKCPIKIT